MQSNMKQFPLNYATNMDIEELSTLHTISFTNPRLNPDGDGDFSVYFALETFGAETLVSDLALFIRTLGRQLIRWSVLGNPNRLDPDNPAHPVLRDLAYCWDRRDVHVWYTPISCHPCFDDEHPSDVSPNIMNLRTLLSSSLV